MTRDKKSWPERSYGEEQEMYLDPRITLPERLKGLPQEELKMMANDAIVIEVIRKYIQYLSKLSKQERKAILLRAPLPLIIERTDALMKESRRTVIETARNIQRRVQQTASAPLLGQQNLEASIRLTDELISGLDMALASEDILVAGVKHTNPKQEIPAPNKLVQSASGNREKFMANLSGAMNLIAMRNGAIIVDDIKGLAERSTLLSSNFKEILQLLITAHEMVIGLRNENWSQEQIEMIEANVGYEQRQEEYRETHNELVKFIRFFLARYESMEPAHKLLLDTYKETAGLLSDGRTTIQKQIEEILKSLEE